MDRNDYYGGAAASLNLNQVSVVEFFLRVFFIFGVVSRILLLDCRWGFRLLIWQLLFGIVM